MNFAQIKELIGIIDSSHLTQFQLTMDNVSVAMNKLNTSMSSIKTAGDGACVKPEPSAPLTPVKNPEAVLKFVDNEDTDEEDSTVDARNAVPIQGGEIVKAPIVGTFYAASGIGKPDFVKVGSHVKTGDVLCILEAMKIMNEIVSPCDGQVAEIYAKNEALVEYGQPLMRILP